MLRLHYNENPYGVVPQVREKALRAVDELNLRFYPQRDARGLREALSDYTGFPADQMVIGNGSNDLLQLVLRAHADELQQVVIPTPTFGMYRRAAENHGLQVIEIPLSPAPDFELDAGAVTAAVGRAPSAVVICHPNNPTGRYFAPAAVDEVLQSDARLIVIDEAYFELAGRTRQGEIENDPRVAVVRTLSKGFGLAGLRVGYLMGQPGLVDRLHSIQTPYNLSAASQAIARVVVENAAHQLTTVDRMVKLRESMRERIARLPGLTPLPSVTNFFLVRVVEEEFGMPPDEIADEMNKKDILIRYFDEVPGHNRISIGLPDEIDQFVEALVDLSNGENG